MSQTSTTPRPSTPATVLVTIANDYQIGAAHSLASELRQEGFNVECYPQVDKLGVQFSYATRRGHQFVLKLDDQNSWVITDMSNNQRRAIGSIKEIREVIS
jgi:histidyl-tRNA synthetase